MVVGRNKGCLWLSGINLLSQNPKGARFSKKYYYLCLGSQECMEDNKFQWIMDRGYLIKIYPARSYWIV